jgi:hypothetical protein
MIKRFLLNAILLFHSCYSFIMPQSPMKESNIPKISNMNNPCRDLLIYNRNIKTSIMLKKNKNDFNIDLDDYKTYLFIFFIICIIRNYVLVMTTLKLIKYF